MYAASHRSYGSKRTIVHATGGRRVNKAGLPTWAVSAHLHRTLLASTVPSTRRTFVQPLDALR